MNIRRILLISSILLMAMAVLSISIQAAEVEKYYIVPVRNLKLNSNERVVGFQANFTQAEISSLPEAPHGWGIHILNNASSNTSISGAVEVGACALDADFFNEFLIIRKSSELARFNPPPFDIQAKIYTTVDFEKTKEYVLKKDDLILKEVKRPCK